MTSVVLGDWSSIPFAIVARELAAFFDGISLVLINHWLILVVRTLNHLLYLAKLKVFARIRNEME